MYEASLLPAVIFMQEREKSSKPLTRKNIMLIWIKELIGLKYNTD